MVRKTSKLRTRRAARREGSPKGYDIYKWVHKLRHPGVVRLSEKGYATDPWRAMRTALGLKPRPVMKAIRKRARPQVPRR